MLKKNKAMTLVETVLVILIVGIITAGTFIALNTTVTKKLDSQARKIVSDLCWAREMAVSKHNNFIFDFDIANEVYFIYEGSINPANLIKKQSLEIDIVSLSVAPDTVTFNFPAGTSQTKDINLNYKNNSKTISVWGQTGYVKIQ